MKAFHSDASDKSKAIIRSTWDEDGLNKLLKQLYKTYASPKRSEHIKTLGQANKQFKLELFY